MRTSIKPNPFPDLATTGHYNDIADFHSDSRRTILSIVNGDLPHMVGLHSARAYRMDEGMVVSPRSHPFQVVAAVVKGRASVYPADWDLVPGKRALIPLGKEYAITSLESDTHLVLLSASPGWFKNVIRHLDRPELYKRPKPESVAFLDSIERPWGQCKVALVKEASPLGCHSHSYSETYVVLNKQGKAIFLFEKNEATPRRNPCVLCQGQNITIPARVGHVAVCSPGTILMGLSEEPYISAELNDVRCEFSTADIERISQVALGLR